MKITFWILATLVLWCYLGYPVYVGAKSWLWPRSLSPMTLSDWPCVTVVLAVRNEIATLPRRVENLLAQEYPAGLLDVIIACNGSTDGTEQLAQRLAQLHKSVQVVVGPSDAGKAGAINVAIAAATAEIIVFADARQLFSVNAVALLVAAFANEHVGAVSGRLLVRRTGLTSVEGVRLYWELETLLRAAESRAGSVVGATGAIYAIRRELFEPLPPNLILDDVHIPLRIAMGGHRVVMTLDAFAFDEPATDQRAEFARKRRTMVGNIQLIRTLPTLLSPFRNPLFLGFVSHKLLRLLTPFCLVLMLGLSALLPGIFYRVLLFSGLTAYALGAIGLLVRVRAFSIPAAIVLVHAAVFSAVWRWRHDASRVWSDAQKPSALAPSRVGY